MKKSLIALAVLAASGAAMAQSSVTLYGIADVWVGSIDVDTGVAASSRKSTQMVSGGVSTSRWGMKGSEDLGGGLKANFQLESTVNLDTGTGAAVAGFDRQAWVGVSGGFGAVKLGRSTTAYEEAQLRSVAMFDSDLSPVNGFSLTQATGASLSGASGVFRSVRHATRADNQIHYQAPNMGGFSGAVSYSLDEKVTTALPALGAQPTATSGKAVTAFNLTYNGGPIGAELAYQQEVSNGTIPAGRTDDVSYLRVGASYNFGVATAKVQYGKVDNVSNFANAETTEYAIGIDVPLSSVMTVAAGYAYSEDNATAGNEERSGYGVAVAYSLSKRTTVYGGVKLMEYKGTTTLGASADVTAYAVGVKHAF